MDVVFMKGFRKPENGFISSMEVGLIMVSATASRVSFPEVTVIKDRKVGGLGSFKSRALLVASSQGIGPRESYDVLVTETHSTNKHLSQVIAFFGDIWQTTLKWWLRLVLSPSD